MAMKVDEEGLSMVGLVEVLLYGINFWMKSLVWSFPFPVEIIS